MAVELDHHVADEDTGSVRRTAGCDADDKQRVDGVFQPAPAPRYSRARLDRPDPPRQEGADGEAILAELGFAFLYWFASSPASTAGQSAYPNIFMAALAVTGLIVAHQVRRILALSFYYEHRPPAQFISMSTDRVRHFVKVRGQQVMWNDVADFAEPKAR